MLRGKVDSDAAKQAAEEITKMLDGVKTVKKMTLRWSPRLNATRSGGEG